MYPPPPFMLTDTHSLLCSSVERVCDCCVCASMTGDDALPCAAVWQKAMPRSGVENLPSCATFAVLLLGMICRC